MPPEQDTIKIKTRIVQGEATGRFGIICLLLIIFMILGSLWAGLTA